MTRVCSFDVFDTVLTRLVGDPQSVFLLLGHRLSRRGLIDYAPEVFARARSNAAVSARKNSRNNYNKAEIMLHDIYRELDFVLRTRIDTGRACEEEMSLEEELLRPVPMVCDEIKRLRDEGHRILFLSDMYLPYGFIYRVLKKYRIIEEADRLYVSCEAGERKATGRLYKHVNRNEKLEGQAVVHLGDNYKADVIKAKENGWKGVYFGGTALNRYEAILESHAISSGGLSSMLAGASRFARLTVPATSVHEQAIRDVAAGVVAPLLSGFILWLFSRAREDGVKRLYFIAREGQLLLKLARIYQKHNPSDIELRYIHGSRQSWVFPAMNEGDAAEYQWLLDATVKNQTIRSLLSLVDIDPDELREILESSGYPSSVWDQEITDMSEVQQIRKLLSSSSVNKLFMKKAQGKREILLEYLEQEGLRDPVPYAFVDSGWHGRQQSAVGRLLNSDAKIIRRGYYLGILCRDKSEHAGEMDAYLFDQERSLGNFPENIPIRFLLEHLCQADHGTTTGYRKADNNRVYPVFKNNARVKVLNEWGMNIYNESLYAAAEKFFETIRDNPVEAEIRGACVELLSRFWERPSTHEARAWAQYPIDLEQHKQKSYTLANAYSISDLAEIFHQGKLIRKYPWSWLSGSLKITPSVNRLLISFVLRTSGLMRITLRPIRTMPVVSSLLLSFTRPPNRD